MSWSIVSTAPSARSSMLDRAINVANAALSVARTYSTFRGPAFVTRPHARARLSRRSSSSSSRRSRASSPYRSHRTVYRRAYGRGRARYISGRGRMYYQ